MPNIVTREMHDGREGYIYVDNGDVRIWVYKPSDDLIRFNGDDCTIEKAEQYIEALTEAVRIAREDD